MTLLDAVLPRFDHRELHRVAAAVPPERALAAARATPAEMPLVRILFRLRGLGRAAADLDAPVFEQLLAIGFRVVAESEREVVVALVGRPWRLHGDLRTGVDFEAFDEPGYAKMAMSFSADGAELATETRVLLTDDAARRRFRVYWLVIRPLSGLVRRSWLRAAGSRARV